MAAVAVVEKLSAREPHREKSHCWQPQPLRLVLLGFSCDGDLCVNVQVQMSAEEQAAMKMAKVVFLKKRIV